jgi:transcriptional/translational regulatory protein YebC/TACO1
VSADGDSLKVLSAAEDLTAVREALEAAGVEIQSAELTMEPKSVVEVAGDAPALMRLMDALDDHDDVEAVHANFDIPAEILERAAA